MERADEGLPAHLLLTVLGMPTFPAPSNEDWILYFTP